MSLTETNEYATDKLIYQNDWSPDKNKNISLPIEIFGLKLLILSHNMNYNRYSNRGPVPKNVKDAEDRALDALCEVSGGKKFMEGPDDAQMHCEITSNVGDFLDLINEKGNDINTSQLLNAIALRTIIWPKYETDEPDRYIIFGRKIGSMIDIPSYSKHLKPNPIIGRLLSANINDAFPITKCYWLYSISKLLELFPNMEQSAKLNELVTIYQCEKMFAPVPSNIPFDNLSPLLANISGKADVVIGSIILNYTRGLPTLKDIINRNLRFLLISKCVILPPKENIHGNHFDFLYDIKGTYGS